MNEENNQQIAEEQLIKFLNHLIDRIKKNGVIKAEYTFKNQMSTLERLITPPEMRIIGYTLELNVMEGGKK